MFNQEKVSFRKELTDFREEMHKSFRVLTDRVNFYSKRADRFLQEIQAAKQRMGMYRKALNKYPN